jgi:hypothetical protein
MLIGAAESLRKGITTVEDFLTVVLQDDRALTVIRKLLG